MGLIQIVVSNAVTAKKALKKLSVPYTVQDVALLPLKNRPGSLSLVVSKLAKAKVNINYVYGTACTCTAACNCSCYVVISAPNLKKVESVWKSMT